jgi:hypothetical protein
MANALSFDRESHTYRLDGQPVPGVTSVLRLLDDFEGVPAHLLEAARKFGSHVHEACALMVRGQLDWARLDLDLFPYVDAARRFIEESGIVVLASELQVAHETLRYAGTLDLIGRWRGVATLIDFKSGQFPRSVGPQTAAYANAYHSQSGIRVPRRYCVQLNPALPNGYKCHALTNSADWSIFVSCLNIHRWKNV